MKYWLCKTEPEVYSIDDLKKDGQTLWDCVRNYQARNYLREMVIGDQILIYHSNAEPPGVVGVATLSKTAVADPTQFDRKSEYFDEKATRDEPRWFSPEFKFKAKFKKLVSLEALRKERELQKMVVLQRGSRLSVQPVTKAEFERVIALGNS